VSLIFPYAVAAINASQLIYSNVDEIVEQQKYIFDSFWAKAIPAEQRIREIQEGK
jgi:two-component system, OmpR family, sensor histidine kinase VicK